MTTRADSTGRQTVDRSEVVRQALAAFASSADGEVITRQLSAVLQPVIPHDDFRLSLDSAAETWWLRSTGFEVERYYPPATESEDSISALRWVALHRQPLLRPNLRNDLRFLKDRIVLDEGRVSSVHIPLFDDEEYFGVLSVASTRPDQYDASSLALLEWIFKRLGSPFTDFITRYRDRSTKVLPIDLRFSSSLEHTLEHILDQIRKTGYDRVRIYLYDADTDEMVAGAQVGIDRYETFKGTRISVSDDPYTQMTLSGRFGRVYRHDQKEETPWLEDELKLSKKTDWAELPLAVDEEGERTIVGKISIDNNSTHRPISESELAGLMGLADTAALAIRNAQMYESKVAEAERSIRVAELRLIQQNALLQISDAVQRMSRPEDIADVLTISLQKMRDLGMSADAIALHRIVDLEGHEIETYRSGIAGPITVAERRVSHGICTQYSRGDARYVDDTEIDEPASGLENFRAKYGGLAIRSTLDLVTSIGLVSVHSCEPAAFGGPDSQLIVQLAEVIALGALRVADLQTAAEARRALQDSEQRYREIVQGAPVCIHEINLDGKLISMNPAGLCMLGLESEDQIRGQDYVSAVADHDRDRVARLLERAVAGEPTFFEFDAASGDQRFQSSFIPILNIDGKVVRLIGMTEDITERTLRDRALKQSEATHRLAIQSIGGTPYVYDFKAQRYDFVGEGVADLFECGPGEFDRDYLASRIDVNESVEDELRRPGEEEGRVWSVREYRLTPVNDVARWIRDTFVITLDDDGNKISSFGILQDVTRQRQEEAEMVRIQRLNATWELSAGISHNLNNILTGVIGPAQILMETTRDTETRERAHEINEAGIRARDLIRQLYASSRTTDKEIGAVNLQSVVEDAVLTARPRWRDQGEAAGIAIKVVVGVPELPPVKATQLELHDVLVNLIFNAVDAMPNGGVIDIRAVESYDHVSLVVSDDGAGMSPDVLNRLFEPFFTTKAEVGTGLGLYTVYHTVRSFGGHIDVESEPGQGSTFTLQLAYADADSTVKDEPEAPVEEIKGARILVVEDEPFVREFLVAALSKDNDVVVYDHPKRALENLEACGCDVVLADLGLPDLPGDRFLARVAEKMPEAARILMTGWELADTDERRATSDYYLQKPVDLTTLYEMLKDARTLSAERGR